MTAVAWVLLGIVLWGAGTVAFDTVHWILHRMLRSRWRLLRALAWPHAIHHQWLGPDLQLHAGFQRMNVFCHLIPEYLTQLAFSAVLWLLLPATPVLVCVALQTAAFAYLISQKGSDVNHRPITMLDAYLPSLFCPPSYHALHHLHPDAYFSAYTKLVDWAVGSGAEIGRRRIGMVAGGSVFGRALQAEFESAGESAIESIGSVAEAARADLDVLIFCDPAASEVQVVEAFVAAMRNRLAPPEVWSLHPRADDPTARHYLRDVRLIYRTLVVPDRQLLDAAAASRAARVILRRVRRGLHFVSCERGWRGLRERRRFRATRPERPPDAPRVRARAELANAA